jgi:hypothetical protein
LDNFGEPVSLSTRLITASFTISALTTDPNAQECLIQTSSAHGLSDGDSVMIYGLTDAGLDRINDEWTVKVVDADELKFLGCTASGTYTSGGVLVVPSGSWSPELTQVSDPADLRTSQFVNRSYSWERDRFYLLSNPVDRMLRVRFTLSGSPPSSDATNVEIDDSLDFFGTYTAAKAASVQAPSLSQSLLAEAIGKDLDEYDPGGHLGHIVNKSVDTMNQETTQAQRFRDPRNTASRLSFGVRVSI